MSVPLMALEVLTEDSSLPLDNAILKAFLTQSLLLPVSSANSATDLYSVEPVVHFCNSCNHSLMVMLDLSRFSFDTFVTAF